MGQPNYTDEQTVELVSAYEKAKTEKDRDAVVDKFAKKFAKVRSSIIAKLVSEKVYIAKTYKTKTGDKPERKSEIVADIAGTLGVAASELSGLDKATKTALQLIRKALPKADKAET